MRIRGLTALVLLTALSFAAACQGGGATKPTVVIAAPPQGSTFTVGEEVQVQSASADPAGVTRVELYVDGALVGQDVPPVAQGQVQFTVIQKWTATAPGQHTLLVRAYNAAGASGEGGVVVNVREAVGNITPPATASALGDTPIAPATASALGDTPIPPTAVAEGDTPIAPSPTTAPPITTSEPSSSPSATAECTPNSRFVADVTIPDQTEMQPNQAFTKTWRLRNTGNCSWESGSVLAFLTGAAMTSANSTPLPATAPGGLADISVAMQAPAQPGVYEGRWRSRTADGQFFGDQVSVIIVVPAPTTAAPPPNPPPTVPVVDLPPFDGGVPIDVNLVSETAISIRVDANVSEDEHSEIDHVDIFILDGNGNQIVKHTENNAPYCYQGDLNGECTVWDFAQHDFKWHNGAPADDGLYFIHAVGYSKNGKVRSEEQPIWLNLTGNAPQPAVFINIEQTAPGTFDDVISGALVFEVSLANNSDLPVGRVDMSIVKYDLTKVQQESESSAPYCAFQDSGGVCHQWVFAQHDNKWPKGAPISKAMYILRAVAYSGNTPVSGYALPIEIQLLN